MVTGKTVRRFAACLAAALVILVLAALAFPHQALLVDSGPTQADVIVLLGGGSGERPTRAAELFRSGAAPKIIVSGAGDAPGNRLLLMNRGVPASAIELEPNSKNTRENARFSIALLRAAGAKRVILVTSWYHSRRALNCFRHYGRGLEFFSSPSYYGFPRVEWSQEHLGRRIRAEYLKTVGYWFCYGVCPF
jgi:uncharacterized SAM-binding protein YcdF (DUF218 family)